MRDNKIDDINHNELNFFSELNNFVTKMYSELMIEKDELVLQYQKNKELVSELKSRIEHLENEISYDENLFKPDYSVEENQLNIEKSIFEMKHIETKNNEIQEKITVLNNKIDEIDNIINKQQNKSYEEYLNNCSDNYKIQILRSQEFERKRIARDIHDTVIQKLTNMIHKSEFTLKVMDVDNIRAKLELMTISKSLRETIDEMRDIIYNLRPMAFDDIGIDVIIERELLKIKERGIKVKYEVIGESCNVDQVVQITLIRIIQEACNNAIKHSDFTEFSIKIIYEDEHIEIFIIDNGKGFEVLDTKGIVYESKTGFGLSVMKERVYLLSGIINFESGKDKGTKIYVRVPKCFREDMKDGN